MQESASPGTAGRPNRSGRSERQQQSSSRRNHACVIGGADDASARTEAAQARIADLDKKIAQYRASMDSGGDPAVIGPWIAETQAQRVVAVAKRLRRGTVVVAAFSARARGCSRASRR